MHFHGDEVDALALTGDALFSGSFDGCICRWNAATGEVGPRGRARASPTASSCGQRVWDIVGHRHPVTSLAVSPDDSLLYSGSADKLIYQRSTENGQVCALPPNGPLTPARSFC